MMRVRLERSGRVDCVADVMLPMSATSAWGQLRDIRRFARQDHFHARVEIEGGVPRAGAKILIRHRFAFVFQIQRVGKILIWREGNGFAFGDQSMRGPRRGFPHTFSIMVNDQGENRCRLCIRIGGRWTAALVPRAIVRAWLWWNFARIVHGVENELLMFALARREIYAERKNASEYSNADFSPGSEPLKFSSSNSTETAPL